MDERNALSASRYGDDGGHGNSRQHGGHGGGGSQHPHHGRRGGGRGHHGRRHQPYNNNNRRDDRRSGRPRGPANRFDGRPQTKSIDPKAAMLRQLSAMISRVGELKMEEASSSMGASDSNDRDTDTSAIMDKCVQSLSKNIADLASVLCSESNAPLFLKFAESNAVNMNFGTDTETLASPQKEAEEAVGPLAHLVVSCVSSLPLQTPSYVGLTQEINQKASKTPYRGFASRCITYSMQQISWDLDFILLCAPSQGCAATGLTMSRIQNVLRYLALLGRTNVVSGHNETEDNDETAAKDLSVGGLLRTLTLAAVQGASSGNQAGCILAHIVLSTIPYTLDYLPSDFIAGQLIGPLEKNVLSSDLYMSTFVPGVGSNSLLLKKEQEENDGESYDVDEDSEDEGEESGACCDTLQDLLRTVKTMVGNQETDKTIRFALLRDFAWGKQQESPEGESDEQSSNEEPSRLTLSKDCISIHSLLNTANPEKHLIKVQCNRLEGVVFGRLPMFDGHDEEGEDSGDEEETDQGKNERLQKYQKSFSAIDRFFLKDAVRNCLVNHISHVTDTGLERGSAKDVATQVWAVRNLFFPAADANSCQGVEYGIIETILSLIVQAKATSALRHTYLSKVLLELTRLEPSVMPQALVVGLSTLFQDYLPSLVPLARDNLSQWFAFHLDNTDYQWPVGYWDLWTPFVISLKSQRNSRGEFLMYALKIMEYRNTSMRVLITDCLPPNSALAKHMLASTSVNENVTDGLVLKEIQSRIWDLNQEPRELSDYMVGEEIGEKYSNDNPEEGTPSNVAWRTELLTRSLFRPAEKSKDSMLSPMDEGEAMHDKEKNNMEDILTILIESIVRYQSVIIATMEFDAQGLDAKNDTQNTEALSLQSCGVLALKQLEYMTRHSQIMLLGCVTCVLKHHIVSGMTVLRWILGDFPDATAQNAVLRRWWDIAALTLRFGCNETTTLMDEDSPESSVGRVTKLVDHMVPLLHFAIRRVRDVLLQSSNHSRERKLSPVQVDLVEGVKQLLASAHNEIFSVLMKDESKDGSDAHRKQESYHTVLSDSEMNGSKLASICQEGDSKSEATDLLSEILGRM